MLPLISSYHKVCQVPSPVSPLSPMFHAERVPACGTWEGALPLASPYMTRVGTGPYRECTQEHQITKGIQKGTKEETRDRLQVKSSTWGIRIRLKTKDLVVAKDMSFSVSYLETR